MNEKILEKNKSTSWLISTKYKRLRRKNKRLKYKIARRNFKKFIKEGLEE